jgi:hypothetical protein
MCFSSESSPTLLSGGGGQCQAVFRLNRLVASPLPAHQPAEGEHLTLGHPIAESPEQAARHNAVLMTAEHLLWLLHPPGQGMSWRPDKLASHLGGIPGPLGRLADLV